MRHSDFLITFGLSSGSPRRRPTSMRNDQDLPVYQVVPSVRAPVTHAARYDVTSPLFTATTFLPSDTLTPSAPEILPPFDAVHRGSHACVPTHQHSDYPKCCKAHFRSAGLSFNRAGFSPAGRLTEFQRYRHLLSIGPAFTGRFQRWGKLSQQIARFGHIHNLSYE
jgi:hypothetical protein